MLVAPVLGQFWRYHTHSTKRKAGSCRLQFNARRIHYKKHFQAVIDNSSEYLQAAIGTDQASMFHLAEELGGILKHNDERSVHSYIQDQSSKPGVRISFQLRSLHFTLGGATVISAIIVLLWYSHKTDSRLSRLLFRRARTRFRPP